MWYSFHLYFTSYGEFIKHWSKITKDENDENVPHLEIAEVVLVYCNIAYNDYKHDSRFVYIYSYKSFGQLPNISPENSIFLETFNSEFSCFEVCFTD